MKSTRLRARFKRCLTWERNGESRGRHESAPSLSLVPSALEFFTFVFQFPTFCSDDLYHDYAKGFIKVSGLPDVIPLTAHGFIMGSITASFLSTGHEFLGKRVKKSLALDVHSLPLLTRTSMDLR